ncbi:Crp/Fnr family transcriptional regulator [Mucilaginibacter myungsuensis]|uniref:Crp/Fnr family transcriptional regulator n=1 Tax=Mucilaginibacter myungsuensis TaxID=649104 RepID=A0A929L1Y8_9SPHI|nr:Crp/Fnr family transcriptional regulator [Mucilaginibacter myungsuensis]MBE9662610.1 Crp/Fnr family transcriptional regulator [Mucilaginibacter myungsuensis]MDN3598030.1 Crp/Fnr family transcriptional regulator [Mucilaginibacter myungsuensis]
MQIEDIISRLQPMSAASSDALTSITTLVSYPKGHVLLKADKIEPYLYFIRKGLVRAYANTVDAQVTFWFGCEGDAVLSMKSYVADEKGYEDIELLADSELYQIRTEDLRALFATDIHIANWGRKLIERELVKTEERLISMQFKTATERYQDLLLTDPNLLQRVQLGYIASYLGISQVSLSRIRADIK